MLRYLTAGESHGQALLVILEGIPSGLCFSKKQLDLELQRRRLGFGRGPRMKIEEDKVEIISGLRHGKTLGSPIGIKIDNSEWPKWQEEMSPYLVDKEIKKLTQPRPGHADLTGMIKYDFDDVRNVLERASARETAARVAAGSVAKALLSVFNVSVISHVIALGSVKASNKVLPKAEDLKAIDLSPVRCFDALAEEKMIKEIKEASKAGDSLGGICQVIAYNVPLGLGSYVHWDRKIDAKLAYGLMSIQAVKAVAIGDGFKVASLRGSKAHDAIYMKDNVIKRKTDRAGGIEGGMTNGEPLVVEVAMKPLSTLNKPVIETIDLKTKQKTVSFKERTDVTAVPAMGVVAEAIVAYVLASEILEKFGGDSVKELKRNYEGFFKQINEFLNN